jgi:hypothetical protein
MMILLLLSFSHRLRTSAERFLFERYLLVHELSFNTTWFIIAKHTHHNKRNTSDRFATKTSIVAFLKIGLCFGFQFCSLNYKTNIQMLISFYRGSISSWLQWCNMSSWYQKLAFIAFLQKKQNISLNYIK